MKYRENINYDLSNGESFIGKVLQATQNVIALSLFDCENITADVTLELYAGPSKNNMEQVKYFNPESGAYEVVSLVIPAGSDQSVLRIKDISQGEFFRLKVVGTGTGLLKELKIIY